MGPVDDGSAVVTSNEGLVEAFLTAFVGGDAEAIADLVTDDCVLHQPRWPRDTEGKEAIVEATRTNEGTFTDLDITVERSVRTDEELAAYVTAGGRNVGAVRMENRKVAPTGRTFQIPQFGHYRIEDGRIAEAWILADALGLIEQPTTSPRGRGSSSVLPFGNSDGDSVDVSALSDNCFWRLRFEGMSELFEALSTVVCSRGYQHESPSLEEIDYRLSRCDGTRSPFSTPVVTLTR